MNDVDQVILWVFDDDENSDEVLLWQNGSSTPLRDLVDLPNSAIIAVPQDINNMGQMAGGLFVPDDGLIGGHFVGVVFSPIDRPIGDVNCDCSVDAFDVLKVLRDWGPCAGVGACPSDIVTRDTFQSPPDGNVDAADLAAVLGNWTISVVPESRKNR